MGILWFPVAWRGRPLGCRAWGYRAALLALLGAAFIAPGPANAEGRFAAPPLIIGDDRGGPLQERVDQLSHLRAQNRAVEIRGNVCFSTCTLYLGLANTCVSPATTFGFHGPSSYGAALDSRSFRQASELIASHYPPSLRAWYLSTGRYAIRRVHRISGRTLISMGVPAC